MALRRLFATSLLVCALAATGCRGDDDVAGTANGAPGSIKNDAGNAKRPPVVIGSKNFTEEFILGEIYAQALEAAGYRVRKRLDVGPELVAYKALRDGEIDAYPEYTGTALTTFFAVPAKEVPKDGDAAHALLQRKLAGLGLTALAPTPFSDSNGFAMTRDGAMRAGNVRTLSDLRSRARNLVLSGSPQCLERIDCKLGLEQVYGLRFKEYKAVELARRHEVLEKAEADVSVVFTTDGQIKADNLVLLEDDRQMLPPYNATLLVRDATLAAAGPDFARVVETVNAGLTTPVMQELNARVDLDRSPPAEVAAQYLREAGYVG